MDLPPPPSLLAEATPLPLRFNRPPRWPEPSLDWLAANQGWDPPAGWTPTPDVPPAEAGWVWWSRDEAGWRTLTAPAMTRFRNGAVLGAVVFVVAVVLTVVPAAFHVSTGLGFVFWSALIFGPITLLQNLGGLRRAPAGFVTFVRNRASEARRSLDTTTYREHVAENGSDALPFDVFLARRAAEAWSSTGAWPRDQSHPGAARRFRPPDEPSTSRGATFATVVFAIVAGIALAGIALDAFTASQAGSGAGSAAFGVSAASGGSTSEAVGGASVTGPAPTPGSHSGPPVGAIVLNPETVTQAACASRADCFVVRVDSTSSCSRATLVLEYYRSSSATTADRHRTVTLDLTGSRYTDAAIAEPSRRETSARVAESFCVRVGT